MTTHDGELAREAENEVRPAVNRFAQSEIEFKEMTVRRDACPITLTPYGFKLLKLFTQNVLGVLTREALPNKVWGYNSYPTPLTVDNQILKLRQKLEPGLARPRHRVTICGAEYKFVP